MIFLMSFTGVKELSIITPTMWVSTKKTRILIVNNENN